MSACRSACRSGITSGNCTRVGRVGKDPREDVRVGVGVGVVEFRLYRANAASPQPTHQLSPDISAGPAVCTLPMVQPPSECF